MQKSNSLGVPAGLLVAYYLFSLPPCFLSDLYFALSTIQRLKINKSSMETCGKGLIKCHGLDIKARGKCRPAGTSTLKHPYPIGAAHREMYILV